MLVTNVGAGGGGGVGHATSMPELLRQLRERVNADFTPHFPNGCWPAPLKPFTVNRGLRFAVTFQPRGTRVLFLFFSLFYMAFRLFFYSIRVTIWLLIRVTPALFKLTILLFAWTIKLLAWSVVGIGALVYGIVTVSRQHNARRRVAAAARPRPLAQPAPATSFAATAAPTATPAPAAFAAPTAAPATAFPPLAVNAPSSSPRRDARMASDGIPRQTHLRRRPQMQRPKLPTVPDSNLDPKGRIAKANVDHWKAARRAKRLGWVTLGFAAPGTVLFLLNFVPGGSNIGAVGLLLFFVGVILAMITLVFSVIGRQTMTPAGQADARFGMLAGLAATFGPVALLFASVVIIGITEGIVKAATHQA